MQNYSQTIYKKYFPFLKTNFGPSYTALKNNFFESCVFLIIFRIGEQEIVS
jgi:hypothetical protein